MDTLGEAIDRLITTSMKLWQVQAWVHESSKKSKGEFDADDQAHDQVRKLAILNRQRNELMTAIDELASRIAMTGKTSRYYREKVDL